MKLRKQTSFRVLKAFFLMISLISSLFLSSVPALADKPNSGGEASGDNGNKKYNCITSICNEIQESSGKEPGGEIAAILKMVIRVFSAVIGILAVTGIIASGLQYILAADDAGKVKAAKERIINIIIGITLYIFMATILHFLVPGGILGGGFWPTNKLVAQQIVIQGVVL